ncbi:hypothetical protein ANCDUO_10526 [Ancylostoma duodenale]|uniref:Uncharacterized protein n=1 Tax=Ancylostoma duodenale TaxID=51022 RepID=A0A0C2GK55_9BILA|nr:hypothetical protein ANCDUO_10526 [Ancylostoma duodenale]
MRNLILLLAALQFVQSQTPQPQCQCIPPPGGAQPCLPYDSRFQAATLEEAMTSFPDLSLDQQEPGQITTLEVGLMPAAIDGAIQAQGASLSTCKKYRFARKDEGVYDKRSVLKMVVDRVYEDDDSSSSEEDEWKKSKRERKEKRRESRHRDKRQVPPSTIDPTSGQTIIG